MQIDLLVVLYFALVKLFVMGVLLFAKGKAMFATRGTEREVEVAGVFQIDNKLAKLDRSRDKIGNGAYITGDVMIAVAGIVMCFEDVVDSARQLSADTRVVRH